MIRLVLVAAGAMGLILLVAFITARLVRARTAGMSIRMQVFLALAGIVGAFAFGLGVLVLDRINARAARIGEEAARDEAGAIAALLGGELEGRGISLTEAAQKLRAPREGGGSLHMALLNEHGHVIFASGPSPTEPGTVSATEPIHAQGRRVGSVRVVKPTVVIRGLLADFAPTILIISTVLGAVAAAAAAVIGRAIATPIEALTDFAVRVSEGERRALPPPAHGREVQRLSRAVDSMRRELEGRPFVETFSADLSHELKNPVAAIRASAEVLADGALAEPEEAERFVKRIQEAVQRIELLLGDLLSLARIEARGVENAQLLDLRALAENVAARARERGTPVELVAAEAVQARGDEAWLTRALDNLVDNAANHGERGAPIHIDVGRAKGSAIVDVRSRGEIAKHVQGRMFRRFVTTRADRGGSGLGLAIVRAVAEAHSGTAACVAVGPPEVVFRLTLPVG
jgi:signal transduction histidine kinase